MFNNKNKKRECLFPITRCCDCPNTLYKSNSTNASKFYCGYDLTNVREVSSWINIPDWCPLPISEEK
jgi:hypothetical protein